MKELLLFTGFLLEEEDVTGHTVGADLLSLKTLKPGARAIHRQFFSGILDLEAGVGNMQHCIFEKSKLVDISLNQFPLEDGTGRIRMILGFRESGNHELSPCHSFFCEVESALSKTKLPKSQEWVGRLDFIERKGFMVLSTSVVDRSFFDFAAAEQAYKALHLKEFAE